MMVRAMDSLTIQPKLKIGQPNDEYEQEADAVADQVMRMPASQIPPIQRKCEDCEEEEELRMKPLSEGITPVIQKQEEEEEEMLQMKGLGHGKTSTVELRTTLQQSKGGGQYLDDGTQSFMSRNIGADFSKVKIHTDDKSVQMNRQLGAKAFTNESHIYFNQGQYNPKSSEGKRLLAHELTHVVQQGTSSPAKGNIQPFRRRYEEADTEPLQSNFFTRDDIFTAILQERGVVMRNFTEGSAAGHLQQALQTLNYRLEEFGVDNMFGDETEVALRAFQTEMGIDPRSHGVLDATTLRVLDNRLSTSIYRNRGPSLNTGESSTGARVFQVPIQRVMGYEEYIIHCLTAMFPISPREAQILRTERNWGISNFRALTENDVRNGFRSVRIENRLYNSVLDGGNHVRRRGDMTIDLEELDEHITANLIDLHNTDPIFEIIGRIAERRAEYGRVSMLSIRESGIDPQTKRSRLARIQSQIDALIAQRDQMLQQRGMTLDTFNSTIEQFKNNFALYAILVADRMLNENEARVNVEQTRYQNPDSLLQITGYAKQLAALYRDSAHQRQLGLEQYARENPSYETDEFGVQIDVSMSNAIDAFGPFAFGTGVRGGNDHYQQYWDKEQEAFDLTQQQAPDYLILAHPHFHRYLRINAERHATMDVDALAPLIQSQINTLSGTINTNIGSTRNSLDTSNIWELEAVISRAKHELGILPNTVHDNIINDAVEEHRSSESRRDILLAVLGIGLGLAALISGPVGWIALAGSITINVIDAVIQYEETTFARAANRTSLNPENALSSVDRSWLWFGLSLAGIGLDVFDAVKLVRAAGRTIDLTEASAEVIQRQLRETVEEAAQNGGRLSDETVELSSDVGNVSGDAARASNEAVDAVNGTGDIARTSDTSTQASNQAILNDPLAAQRAINDSEFVPTLRMLRQLDEAGAIPRLASHLEDGDVVRALLRLQREGKTVAFDFLTGAGSDFLPQLPRVLQASDAGNLARLNPQLYDDLLRDPRIQRVLLDHSPDGPQVLLDAWDTWRRAQQDRNIVSNFAEYLSRGLGYHTSVRAGRTDTLLSQAFGAVFSTWDNLVRNQAILRLSAPRLMAVMTDGSLQRQYPHIATALRQVLESDLIGAVSTVNRARSRVVRQINIALGESAQTVDEFRRVTQLLDQSGSIGSVGETFARAQRYLPGPRVPGSNRIAVDGIQGFDSRRFIIPDQIRLGPPNRMVDIKTGYENTLIDADQLEYYYQLISRSRRGQSDVTSALTTTGIPNGVVDGHDYLFLPRGIEGDARAAAQRAFELIQSRNYGDFMHVYFLDDNGVVQRFTASMLDDAF